jgi:hypothetical protein
MHSGHSHGQDPKVISEVFLQLMAGAVSQFTISNANSSMLVWDVTNPIKPQIN